MAEIINREKFEAEVINGNTPAIVDFFATWCMPCKIIAPFLEEISQEMTGKINVFKIDIDENLELASAYQIRSVPTVLFFKGGALADRIIGAVPKEAIMEKADALL